MRQGIGLLFLVALAAGCDPNDFHAVPVSGRVTLDDKPLPDAVVTFQPQAVSGAAASGPGSYGRTDADGRFSLRVATDDTPGAVVGKHIVTISVAKPGTGDALIATADDILPAEIRNGRREFTVPAAGTEAADFALQSPRP